MHRPWNRRTVLRAGAGLATSMTFSTPTRADGAPNVSDLDPEQDPIRTCVTTPGGTRIHAIQTGCVAVKTTHRQLSGPAFLRVPSIVLDSDWTEWLPIHCWVIEHEEGLIAIDAGETARTADPDYFNCDGGTRWFYTRNLRFAVRPEDEIAAQMTALGLEPRELRWLILTHLHSDHMGGLPAFPKATIFAPQADYPASQGTLPCRYPDWFAPLFPTFRSADLPGLDHAAPVTAAGDVLIVPTPGHSDGHHSVLLLEDETGYLFAGDASFDEAQLLGSTVAGICSDIRAARATLAGLRTYLAARPTVYLPTHDPLSPARLTAGRVTMIPL